MTEFESSAAAETEIITPINHAIILAGGKATRMGEGVPPKALLEIAEGKRIIDLEIEMLRRAGIDNIIMATGAQTETFKASLGKSTGDMMLHYAGNESFAGTGGAVRNAMELLPPEVQSFVVMNGDSLFSLDLRNMMAMHQKREALITVAGYETRNPYGVLTLDDEGKVINFTEKPKFIGSTGMYILSREIKPYLPEQGSIEHDTFPHIPEDRFYAFTEVDYFFNINSPQELQEGRQAVASGKVIR